MAKVLTFKYDCGYEVSMPMQPEMTKTSLAAWAGPMVSKRHRRECVDCREKRRWSASTSASTQTADPPQEEITFSTRASREASDDQSQEAAPKAGAVGQVPQEGE